MLQCTGEFPEGRKSPLFSLSTRGPSLSIAFGFHQRVAVGRDFQMQTVNFSQGPKELGFYAGGHQIARVIVQWPSCPGTVLLKPEASAK